MQERCEVKRGLVVLFGIATGATIRHRTEGVAPGDLLVAAGTCQDPLHDALFAATETERVPCIRPLGIALIPTEGENASGQVGALVLLSLSCSRASA